MKRPYSAAWRAFRATWKELLLFVLFFQALTFVLLAPAGSWVLARLVSAGGSAVVSNEEMAAFFLSPLGVVSACVAGIGFLALELTGLAGLIWIAAGRGTAYLALVRIVRDAPRVLAVAAWQIGIGFLCLLPFLAAGLVAFLLLVGDSDINYFIVKKPPSFWVLAAIVGGLALGALAVAAALRVRWTFAIPLHLFEKVQGRASLSASRQLVKGAFWRVARVLVGWWIAALVLGFLSFELLSLIGYLGAQVLAGSVKTVVALSVLMVLLHLLWAAAISYVAWAGQSALVLDLYRERRGLEPETPTAERPPRQARVLLVTAVVGLVVLAVVLVGIIGEVVDVQRDVKVTAHRGSSARAPENSLSALRAAIEDGADYAEIDVQETADGHVVLLHDTDLKRIAGVDKKIWEVELAELKRYDAGSWFGEAFRDERVPTLDEAIDLVSGRLELNIELKFNGHDKDLAAAVVRIVKAKKFGEKCVISSLHYPGVREVRQLDPSLKVGHIVFDAIGDLTRQDVDFLSVRTAATTADLVRRAHGRGLEVHVWTVNRED
ncbi:MAG: glycerophosphodiester phosphodiesterase family protein, partial [Planctomycetota bacterium]